MTSNSEPSKTSGNYKSVVGGITETVGNLVGSKDIEQSGAQQKAEGDVEYKAAQAEGYVQGTSDRVGGKIDNVVGAVTGDKTKQVSGQARNEKGEAQQELNSTS